MPERVDVLVVGAGPAGLSAAHTTAAAGLETLVVEREPAVAAHVRTSGATATSTVTRLATPPDLYHRLAQLRIVSPHESATFPCEGALSVLDVRGFYRWLASRAAGAGTEIATSATATDPITIDGAVRGWTVERGGVPIDIEARVVVDAGGHRAQVSKRSGLHPGFSRFGVGAEYELTAPEVDEGEAVLIVGERYAPAGYAWSFPWGKTRVRLGVGVHHADVRDDPRRHIELLHADEAELRLGLGGARVAEYHFGLIPAEGLAARFTGEGVVAVGDAAGQASLVVGEGIRISLLAGELAGETIVEAAAGRASLTRYEERFRREYGRDLRLGARVNRRLAAARDDARWDERLRMLRTVPPDLVVDLLQSRFDAPALMRWYAARPSRLFRSSGLVRALLLGH